MVCPGASVGKHIVFLHIYSYWFNIPSGGLGWCRVVGNMQHNENIKPQLQLLVHNYFGWFRDISGSFGFFRVVSGLGATWLLCARLQQFLRQTSRPRSIGVGIAVQENEHSACMPKNSLEEKPFFPNTRNISLTMQSCFLQRRKAAASSDSMFLASAADSTFFLRRASHPWCAFAVAPLSKC